MDKERHEQVSFLEKDSPVLKQETTSCYPKRMRTCCWTDPVEEDGCMLSLLHGSTQS